MTKKEETEEGQEEPKKKEERWEVNLVITNEDQPPKKVFVKGKETLDLYAMTADIRNEIEKIKKELLS